jgi:pimeloyl-ACP methyl ester carboxylesterase
VADCAADVAAILDAIEAATCITIGPSGGGPHALAVAALLPRRTLSCATVGSLAVFGAAELDWFAGMGRDLVATYQMSASGDDLGLTRFLDEYRRGLHWPAPQLFDTWRMPLAQIDAQALSGAFGRHLFDDVRKALRTGIWGWYDDAFAFTRPWGFEVAAISVPVTVWQGGQDRMVPPAHGAWLASHIPGAVLESRPTHGHMSLAVDGFEQILDEVLARAAVPGHGQAGSHAFT